MKKIKQPIFKILGIILILNLLSTQVYFRKDLTSDQRFTLSKISKTIVSKLTDKVIVKVYLYGDFPLDFKRLSKATEQHLEELITINSNIEFSFVDPTGIEEELVKKGLQPSSLTVENEGSISEMLIFPYAVINYKKKEVIVPLLIHSSANQDQQLQRSIENLEFAFSEAFSKLNSKKKKSVAVLRGNGTLEDIYLYDFLSNVSEKYNLAPFTLQPKGLSPTQILSDLENYDALLIPKPTIAFSESDKLILDQYIMNGGKTLWMIDQVYAEMDSLQQTGEALFMPRDLNLTDLLFSYGVRINFDLVQDLYSSKIAIATGNIGGQPQFKQFLWHYYPLITPNANHSISKNVDAVNVKFPSGIDTLSNDIQKTILLKTSALTRIVGLPNMVSLASLAEKIDPNDFKSTPQNIGVLLEGNFKSAYANRTKPFPLTVKNKSLNTKMIVIADGDIGSNQIQDGQPTSLNIDKWTGQNFGNRDFLLNCVDYLLDEDGLITLRSKTLDIKMLNLEIVKNEKSFWQFVTIVFPLIIVAIFGLVYNFWRKKNIEILHLKKQLLLFLNPV